MTNAHALRLQLLQAGYLGLVPLFGKEPPVFGKNNPKKGLAGWQKIESVTPAMLDMWDKTWPDAQNTGVLTRTMPTLDLGILDEAAAYSCQQYVQGRYEDAGYLLIRVGKAPKFAIPFRTEEPFKKIVVNLIAPDGSEGQKIEFLADGEQVVVAGTHPETQRVYSWSNGGLEQVKHEDLPYTREEEARQLIDELVDLLERGHGYKRASGRPKKSDRDGGGEDDWSYLFENILQGRELHDSIVALAAKLAASGQNSGAIRNQLLALVKRSTMPKDARWRARIKEIPAAVDSAMAKYGRKSRTAHPNKQAAEPAQEPAAETPTDPSPPIAPRLEAAHKVCRKWLGKDTTPTSSMSWQRQARRKNSAAIRSGP
jgi:hypothetical protein